MLLGTLGASLIVKYKNIIKMNQDLMMFILQIIYQKKGWGICNKAS